MVLRLLGVLGVILGLSHPAARAQSAAGQGTEPAFNGRPLHEWVAELKAPAPSTRNAAAYAIAGMGAAASAAVPALIEALDDPAAAVRFPVTVALSEIGPGAGAAVPRLLVMVDEDFNDEVAAAARRAIRHIKPEALQGP